MSTACPHLDSVYPRLEELTSLGKDAPASGRYHEVRRGDTLYGVAKTYGVDVQELAEVNNLEPPFILRVGSRIFVPGANKAKNAEQYSTDESDAKAVEEFSGLLAWPADGEVVSFFGIRDGTRYNGISIGAPEGAPVRSASDGVVGYVGNIKGYGNVILIEHSNRLLTVYGNVQNTRVKKGWKVKTGEVVGTVGHSDSAGPSSLYFEVRSRSKPRNPLFFLKRRPVGSKPNADRAESRSLVSLRDRVA
jgi:lipoprotein NlpD